LPLLGKIPQMPATCCKSMGCGQFSCADKFAASVACSAFPASTASECASPVGFSSTRTARSSSASVAGRSWRRATVFGPVVPAAGTRVAVRAWERRTHAF
jgi:hypothetical protein